MPKQKKDKYVIQPDKVTIEPFKKLKQVIEEKLKEKQENK